MSDFEITSLNRVKRLPDRGHYDRDTIYPIVDAGLICHVAFVVDGRPFVIPTLHARDGDTLLLLVDQTGVACHTGRRSCFFRRADGKHWTSFIDAEVDPKALYHHHR